MEVYEFLQLAVPIVITSINAFLKTLKVPKSLMPITSLFIGLVFGILFYYPDIKHGVINGVLCGLSASGANNLLTKGRNRNANNKS